MTFSHFRNGDLKLWLDMPEIRKLYSSLTNLNGTPRRDERIIGMLTLDKIDHDFGWVTLGRDERQRFRAIDVNVSFPTKDVSRTELFSKMVRIGHRMKALYQADDPSPPTDFFTPIVDRS